MHKTIKLILRYPDFKVTLDNYLTLDEFSKLSKLTLSSKRITLVSFMNYLGDNQINNFHNCFQNHVTGYMCSIANLASSTISSRSFILRHFFNYLYQKKMTFYSGNELFPVIFTNKRERILSFYSVEEIKRVTTAVDRNKPYGKRDIVVILLAAELGIRSGDIIRLKLSDIHWERSTIEFIQYKTGVFNQLPLLENIKYSLLDYLKNERPTNDYENIFIGIKNGYKPISNTCVHYIVSKYFTKAGVDTSERRHGPHAMRHSLASNLLQNNTPMYVIKEVLGHTNLNTTKVYLNIDIDTLKKFALEVPYETV